MQQGDTGADLFLLLDGVLGVSRSTVIRSRSSVPGAILGEQAVLEGGIRTASLQAKTDVRVAVASADQIDRDALVDLREQRRR